MAFKISNKRLDRRVATGIPDGTSWKAASSMSNIPWSSGIILLGTVSKRSGPTPSLSFLSFYRLPISLFLKGNQGSNNCSDVADVHWRRSSLILFISSPFSGLLHHLRHYYIKKQVSVSFSSTWHFLIVLSFTEHEISTLQFNFIKLDRCPVTPFAQCTIIPAAYRFFS